MVPLRNINPLRRLLFALAAGILFPCLAGQAQIVPGSMNIRWDEGAPNCAASFHVPLQVHSYNSGTFILRESLCSTDEAPFLYLLIGSNRSVLIDTGDVADPARMPLAATVMKLIADHPSAGRGLLVVHTHRHLDHRSGDTQFAHLANVQVVGFDLASIQHFYGFKDWPNGFAQIDLGDRIVDVIPSPGHNETELCFYDRETGLLFSGDFLMPARLLIENTGDDRASAQRLLRFLADRPVTFVLGGHIEEDAAGQLFAWQSQYHPHERVLQMARADLLALPAALESFNGFYTVRGRFTMENTIRILIVSAILASAVLAVIVWWLVRFLHRRRAQKHPAHPAAVASAARIEANID